jgi:hypothetical protein
MDRLSDFKPLEKVTLPDIGDLQCSGLILIVGPNSSGKSQLLQDLYLRICGEPRSLVVAKEVRIGKPEYEPFLRCLESEGYFTSFIDDSGISHWRPLTTYVGTGQAVTQIQHVQAQNWHNSYQPIGESNLRSRIEFLNYFGKLLVTALFLERRLTSLNQVGVIDFQTIPPQQDLHALYLDDTARSQLHSEILESFAKAVWPDASRGSILCLRVSDEGVLPTPEERLSPKKMSTYRTIETEGDGLKSYVATCVALLLGRRPVCLVDEPEMCLHPPQAYNLGRFIGKCGPLPDTVTFAATHSSQILRGVIQTAKRVQIVRLSRRGHEFAAHLVPAEILAEAVAKPTVRAESVLDGIFAQSVIVLEGDGDRLVYQTTLETLNEELRLDVHFAAVGGTGGIADTCKLYRTLNIPVAVIADLDMVADRDKLKRVLDVMASPDVANALFSKASAVTESIRKLPPQIDSEEVKTGLAELSNMPLSWNEGHDINVRRELKRIANQLDRMRRLKRGGISAFPDPVATALAGLVLELMNVGIFLVPVGELEMWLAAEKIPESKANKWAWANAAALCIQTKGASEGDIWDFVRKVSAYLSQKLRPATAHQAPASVATV